MGEAGASGRASYRSGGDRRELDGVERADGRRRAGASSTPPSTPASARRRRPPAPRPAGLHTGDDVRHAKFGDGVIIMIEGEGDKAEAVAALPDAGEAPAAGLVALQRI
jgi:hypothetical protein